MNMRSLTDVGFNAQHAFDLSHVRIFNDLAAARLPFHFRAFVLELVAAEGGISLQFAASRLGEAFGGGAPGFHLGHGFLYVMFTF
jgi:hypothetical protein